MNVIFKATNYDIADSMRKTVEQKMEGIKKMLGKGEAVTLCEVELGRITDHHKNGAVYRAEANVDTGEKLYRATAHAETMEEAVGKMGSELTREVKKDTDRARSYFRAGGLALKSMLRGWR